RCRRPGHDDDHEDDKGSGSMQARVTLRRAALTIFGLIAVLPILLFTFFMWRFERLHQTEAQVGVLLAVLIALLGFVLFRQLVDRVANLSRVFESPGHTAAAKSAKASRARWWSSASRSWSRTSRRIPASVRPATPSTAAAPSSACRSGSVTISSASSIWPRRNSRQGAPEAHWPSPRPTSSSSMR